MGAIEAQIALLEEAINIERKGYRFSTEAAEKASDSQARDILRELASDEQYHEQTLEEQRQALQTRGAFDLEAARKAADRSQGRPRPSIIPAGRSKEAAIARASGDELRALEVGMETERRSYDFYQRAAEQVQEPPVERLYRSLADWENGHYLALQEMHEFLADPEAWYARQEKPIYEG